MGDIQSSKSEIVIVGAGGLAREIISWHNTSKKVRNTTIVGLLDDDITALDDFDVNTKICGTVDLRLIAENQLIICAISNVDVKKMLFSKAIESNVTFANFIHETCIIGERTKFGSGLVILPYAIISCDVTIGNLVFINCGSLIGHDVKIGDFTSIMANVDIGGGAIIGNNVFIGTGAVILPRVKIPDGTRIGAGAVVLKSIKQSGSYFGNPAKKIF